MVPSFDSADDPRLVAIAGPCCGEVVRLNGTEMTIGRDHSNAVCLADLALSRRHCAITMSSPLSIRDLGSSNGTFVNGMQVTEQPLAEGDRIQLGESVFVFVARPADHRTVPVTFTGTPGSPTMRLPLEDARYLQTNARLASPDFLRSDQTRRALLRIINALDTATKEEDIYTLLGDLLEETVSTEQIAILTVMHAGTPVVLHARSSVERINVEVDDALLRRVTRDRVGELQREPASVLCAPLAFQKHVYGVVHLRAQRPDAFDREDLELVTAIASVAAIAIGTTRRVADLAERSAQLQSQFVLPHQLVGRAPSMQRVYGLVGKVAPTDATVLLTGQPGTGKELVARAIHLNSPRAKQPFVAINCAALVDSLVESELFGYERGAFTNAVTQKKGKLETADDGTLFLDEIGELQASLQSKLLRVLQEREIERVGGLRPIPINVRVIAATNRILRDEVAAGRFRRDLYDRLNVVTVELPRLSDRRDDIPLLANFFAHRAGEKVNRRIHGVSAAALRYLIQYDWPGNVRELENAIERAAVLGSSEEILAEDLPESIIERPASGAAGVSPLHDLVRETKIRAIRQAFRQAGRSYTDTARILGLHPNYLHRLIKNLGVKSLLEPDER